jgi:hypothetical protein
VLTQAVGHRKYHDVQFVLRQAQANTANRILIAPLPPAQVGCGRDLVHRRRTRRRENRETNLVLRLRQSCAQL